MDTYVELRNFSCKNCLFVGFPQLLAITAINKFLYYINKANKKDDDDDTIPQSYWSVDLSTYVCHHFPKKKQTHGLQPPNCDHHKTAPLLQWLVIADLLVAEKPL